MGCRSAESSFPTSAASSGSGGGIPHLHRTVRSIGSDRPAAAAAASASASAAPASQHRCDDSADYPPPVTHTPPPAPHPTLSAISNAHALTSSDTCVISVAANELRIYTNTQLCIYGQGEVRQQCSQYSGFTHFRSG